jgi:hypothetical protein
MTLGLWHSQVGVRLAINANFLLAFFQLFKPTSAG